jgi:LmbE family N-acetylglucosaminyl deacetylase
MSTPTLLVVHAHPDDEVISTGGLLAVSADRGIRTVVVTCTDGALGVGDDRAEVARVRSVELEESCAHLGVSELVRLGHRDSGRNREMANDDSFIHVPVDEVATRVRAIIVEHRPDVVVTYPPDGGYGHPDHIHTHDATMAATRDAPGVQKIYFTARSERFRSTMQRVVEQLASTPDGVAGPPPRTPATARITTVIDTSGTLDRRRAAFASHQSQLAGTQWLRFPDDAFAMLFGEETYVRAFDTTGAALPETDLFAGISFG